MGNNRQNESFHTLLSAIDEIQKTITEKENVTAGSNIVDIITFCNDPSYLDLPRSNFKLFVSQKVILKTFYMGSIGNEDVVLTDDEWEWLKSNEEDEEREGIVYEKNIKDVIRKINSKERNSDPSSYFKELHLVLGRRSSKTTIASIITVYEAYKLLVINEGNPHAYYNLPYDDEIAIINVALSQQQAGRLFFQIQSRLRNAPFFRNRIAKQTSSEIRLYTDLDLKKIDKGTSAIDLPGSVLLLCGHSNPDSLAGYSAILILFDEIGFFDENGKVTGKYFYNRLTPSLAKFYKYNAARIVQISSPNMRNGIFYDTWKNAKTDDTILSFQLPSWDVNPDIIFDGDELAKARKSNIEMFAIEYGAQWARGGTYGNYFPEGLVDRCIRGDIHAQDRPYNRFNYYMHIDPAKKGNNYACVMVAKERYPHMGQARNRLYLAGIWVWRPIPGIGLKFSEIDQKIIQICKVFHPSAVTYDDYHSMHSLQLLRSNGIPCQQLPYNRSVKQKIYQNLKDLMSFIPDPELYLYDDGGDSALLVAELKSLKFRSVSRGVSFMTDKQGDTKTDDLSDSLAGACASANEGLRIGLPQPVVIYTGRR